MRIKAFPKSITAIEIGLGSLTFFGDNKREVCSNIAELS